MGDCVIDYQGCRSMISCQISGEHDIWWNLLKHELSGWLVAFDLHFHNNMWALQCTKTYILQYPVSLSLHQILILHTMRGKNTLASKVCITSTRSILSKWSNHQIIHLTKNISPIPLTLLLLAPKLLLKDNWPLMTIPFQPSNTFCSTTSQNYTLTLEIRGRPLMN